MDSAHTQDARARPPPAAQARSIVLADANAYKILNETHNSRGSSKMAATTTVFGALLVALGLSLFGLSDLPIERRYTALIPALFGAVLIVCGVVARNEKLRKHAMHAAAGVAACGGIGGLVRGIMGFFGERVNLLAAGGQIAMGVLCGVFVALCVKSFIDARKARKQAEAA